MNKETASHAVPSSKSRSYQTASHAVGGSISRSTKQHPTQSTRQHLTQYPLRGLPSYVVLYKSLNLSSHLVQMLCMKMNIPTASSGAAAAARLESDWLSYFSIKNKNSKGLLT